MSLSSPGALLAALEALELPEPPAARSRTADRGPDRFAWHLSPSGSSLRVDVFACHPIPRGWREGDRLPLKDLPEPGKAGWEDLGSGERAAFEALRAWSRKPTGLPFVLLAALEGHTRLSWAAASGYSASRVALARELSVLVVREVPQGWQLALSRRPGPEPVQLWREGDRLLFTAFGPVHRALDARLGAERTIPAGETSRLAALLARLLPHLPLLSDLAPTPAETRPCRALGVWLKGGGERLDLRIFAQPAPGLPWYPPGEGPLLAIAGEPRARQVWRRDLVFEQHRAAQLKALLPASAKAQREPFSWRIEGAEAAATVLAALRDLGPKVHLGGVPGLEPRLPVHPELSAGIRETAHGTELSATLDGRPLASLLPQLRQGSRFLPLEDGRILDLSGLPGLRQVALWGEPRGTCVSLPAAARPALATLGLGRFEEAPEGQPVSFLGSLRPYQLEGFRWMARLLGAGLGACLADDMGLGKTVQTAALLAHRTGHGPALVVAPTSVATNWRLELERFVPALRVRLLGEGDRGTALRACGPGEVILASYGLLLSEAMRLEETAWGTVVLDEAHAIKNPGTQRAQASRRLRTAARLALTGTPVENHPEELASLMGWLLPDLESRFLTVKDVESLKLLASPFLLRRRKAEVLKELPPRTDLTVRVELEGPERTFHTDLLERCRTEALSGGVMNILAALMKLRRACAHPALVDPGYAGPGAKLDLLLDHLALLKEEGHRSLVFSQFTDLLDLVQPRLEKGGITYRRLDGSMSAKTRQQAVEAFQKGEADVFLLSLRAGGTGLNLTAADDVFHLDPWWNPAVEDQASDRAHRMGRTRPVTVHRLVAADTVEERVLALHEAKRAMVENLLEGREQTRALDRETLQNLLG